MKAHPHSTADLRNINRNRVYQCLYHSQELRSKQELARELAMSLPTLSQYVDELLAQGLVDDSGMMDSTGGRKPRGLSAAPGARFALGAELSSQHMRLVAVDLSVQELAAWTVSREFHADRAYGADLAQAIEELMDQGGLDRQKLLGVGITVPGIVDSQRQIISNAPTLHGQNIDASALTAQLPWPVHLSNDATAGGFAECWGREGAKDLAYLSLSRGVGGAILVGGAPYLGSRSRSAEFGHMCIHRDGAACACGRRGCLEAYCSTSLLSDDLGVTLEQFFDLLDRGNRAYEQLWGAYLDDLAAGIANIHTALDCEVVLGGKLTPFLAPRIGGLEARLQAIDPDYRERAYLSICRYYAKANSIGAALYFIDQFIRHI